MQQGTLSLQNIIDQVSKEKGCVILEECCLACLNRAKHCPDDAVKIVNLPINLETNLRRSVLYLLRGYAEEAGVVGGGRCPCQWLGFEWRRVRQ